MTGPPDAESSDFDVPEPLRLSDAGDAQPAWITVLTTEHYNLQTQRAATIGEANGRASLFVGALSAGLIALGFQQTGHRSTSTTIFQVVVLSSLAFLGAVTFLRCLEIAIDDRQYAARIDRLRAAYAQLMPELADLLHTAAGVEQSTAMLTAHQQPIQGMLSVPGTIGVMASIVFGADIGVLIYGLGAPLSIAIPCGFVVGLVSETLAIRFQRARWLAATTSEPFVR